MRNELDQPSAGEEDPRQGQAATGPVTATSQGDRKDFNTHLQSCVHGNCRWRFMAQINCGQIKASR